MSILIVEDEAEIRELISLHLKRNDLQTKECGSGEEALSLLNSGECFQLILIDWMLPRLSGLDVIKKIKSLHEQQNIPILMVTAKAEPEDVVCGLEAGADDYVIKPFTPHVLVARVKSLLRRQENLLRYKNSNSKPTRLNANQILLNLSAHECHYAGTAVHLTLSEFKLLTLLMENLGLVLTREHLVREIQGAGINVVSRTIDTHMVGLRKKLGPSADCIETIRGIGYRMNSPNEN